MDKIQVAIIGAAGGRGSWFVQRLAEHGSFSIVGLVDTMTEAAEVMRDHLTLTDAKVYATTEQALEDGNPDAIVVATPDGEHPGPVLSALQAGKHVYVEKPLAIDLNDCLSIIEADEQAGGRTMVGFNLRYAPFYRKMREVLRSGKIGRPLTIQADEFYYGGRTYFRRWNRLKAVGGGLWITKSSHDFDLLYWMADMQPERVRADATLTHYVPRPEAGKRCGDCPIEAECPDSNLQQMRELPDFRKKIFDIRDKCGWPPRDMCLYNSDKDTFDHGVAEVRFESDITAVYTVNVVASHTERRMRIAGTDGMIEGSLLSPEVRFWKRHATPMEPEIIPATFPDTDGRGGHGGGDARLMDEFASFVRGEDVTRVEPAEASVAVALGLAATRAHETESVVSLTDVPGWTGVSRRLS